MENISLYVSVIYFDYACGTSLLACRTMQWLSHSLCLPTTIHHTTLFSMQSKHSLSACRGWSWWQQWQWITEYTLYMEDTEDDWVVINLRVMSVKESSLCRLAAWWGNSSAARYTGFEWVGHAVTIYITGFIWESIFWVVNRILR